MFVSNPFKVQAKDSVKFNTFDLSHDVKLSLRMGQLVPFLCKEVLPNDAWSVNSEVQVRVNPLLAPVMQRIDICTEYFFVPNRILWKEWEDFIAPNPNRPIDAYPPEALICQMNNYNSDRIEWSRTETDPESPMYGMRYIDYREIGCFESSSLADYLGLPTQLAKINNVNSDETILLTPFLAYQKIWNDFYRDENLQKDLDYFENSSHQYVSIFHGDLFEDPSQLAEVVKLRYRCWEKDYFTTSLPRRQAGNPVMAGIDFVPGTGSILRNLDGSSVVGSNAVTYPCIPPASSSFYESGMLRNSQDASKSVIVDSHSSLGINVFQLGIAQTYQRMLQKLQARGLRYKEQILALFGSYIPDERLMRPLYLGGNRAPLQIGEVLQTAPGTGDSTVGDLYGRGIGYCTTQTKHSHKFLEHGFIIGLISIVPRTEYTGGLERIWRKFDRLDYAFPDFCNVGDQEVYKREVNYAIETSTGTSPVTRGKEANNEIFGYQQRYAEYKYFNSTVHGDFINTLDYWHQARKFHENDVIPLNEDMVSCHPTDRIFAVETNKNNILVQIHNSIVANRPLTLNI